MDDLLRQAYERRERLRRELRAIEEFITRYEQINSNLTSSAESPELALNEAKPVPKKRSTRPDLTAVMDAAEAAILTAEKPLSRSALVRTLEQQGFTFPGSDRTKVFGTNLWRSGRFRSLKGLGYWPEAHPLPTKFKEVPERPSQVKERMGR